MENVRFSIIENNLHWENEKKHAFFIEAAENEEDNLNDDETSISSESSCCEDYVEANRKLYKKFSVDWIATNSPTEIESNALKDLPFSGSVLEDLTIENWENIKSEPEKVTTALLLSVFVGNVNAVKYLLNDCLVDVNISDKNGRTALHWACSIGQEAIVKLLLERGAIVNQWDKAKKFTPLHCAAVAESIHCLRRLLEADAHVNAGIETRSALHLAVEKNAIGCVDLLLKHKANPNTPQVYTETTLHTAAALGHLECMKLLLANGADVRSLCGNRRMTALHLAAENSYLECVKLLLQHGANPNVRNSENKTPLHLACLSQCAETVEILIKHGADVNATYNDGRTALHAAIVNESKCLDCTRNLLLAGANVNQADNYGYTPLHIAALNESSACALLLIEYGADVTARTHGGITALSFIVRRTPEVIPKYLNKFDHSIKVNEHEIGDVDCEIKLDLRLLVPNPERGESDLLLSFIEVGQKRILKHPLCETFLFLKWRRIRKFFLFSLFYHTFYVLLFSILINGIYEKDCPMPAERVFSIDENSCAPASYIPTIGKIVVFMNLMLLAKEFFQMGHGFIGYIKYWENWVQWTIICGVFFCATPNTLITGDLKNVPNWQYHVAAVVIFLVWLELMMIVGRFPIFGLYVQMFTKVAINFAKFLLAYSCLLIAFGLSFGVLFNSYPAFKSVPWTLLKTITMMSGELEFEDIFYDKDIPIQFPGTSHALFFAFVVLVTIILMNLLVGLAVSDIQGLQDSAGLDRLTRQAELIARLESIFFSRFLQKAPYNFMNILQRSALLRTSRYHLQFTIRPNDPRDKRLPKDLVLSIYKLVAERRDRNMSIKRRKREQKFSSFVEQNLSNALTNDGIQLRNRLGHGIHSNPSPNRPQSVNTGQSTKIRHSNSPVFLDVDFKIRTIANQLSDMTNKLQAMDENLMKKLENIDKEIVVLRDQFEKS